VTFDTAFLIAGIVAEITVVAFMLRRKVYKTLPIFFSYIVWSLITDSLNSFVLSRYSQDAYNRIYFYTVVPDALLQFSVLIELAWSVLRPSRGILPRGTIFLLIFLVALAGLATWPLSAMIMPANSSPNASAHALLFTHFQQTIAILRVVCFLVMAGFSQILSIGWKDRELQVATGLGFFSIISLMVTVIQSHQLILPPLYIQLNRVVMISYLGTLSYWIMSFATKEQERKEFSPQMQSFLVLMGGGARAGRIALGDLPSEHPRKRIK
jgi:hypothetical protein